MEEGDRERNYGKTYNELVSRLKKNLGGGGGAKRLISLPLPGFSRGKGGKGGGDVTVFFFLRKEKREKKKSSAEKL